MRINWIPAHTGVSGNEQADHLAKQGSMLPQFQHRVAYRESKTLLKVSYKASWSPGWSRQNGGYIPSQDSIYKLDRKSQVAIYRLRTGHCGLRKHLKRLGIRETASCECGNEEQTPEHILMSCPLLEMARRKTWTTETTLQTKLWGSADDLKRTAGFVAASTLQI